MLSAFVASGAGEESLFGTLIAYCDAVFGGAVRLAPPGSFEVDCFPWAGETFAPR